MKLATSLHDNALFEQDVFKEIVQWLVTVSVFAVAGLIGIFTGYASFTFNAFIAGLACCSALKLLLWLRTFKRHIDLSQAVLKQCSGWDIRKIVNYKPAVHPISLTILQGLCLQRLRGRSRTPHVLIDCYKRKLKTAAINRTLIVSKVLMGFGLCGTCVGMMSTIAAIGAGAADVTDVDAVSKSIAEALPAMAVAVSTTLTGAFFFVVLSGMVMKANNLLEQFSSDLEVQLAIFPMPRVQEAPKRTETMQMNNGYAKGAV